MKGYKALNMNMRAIYGNHMKYELNKWYHIDGKVSMCENGYHFCKDLFYTTLLYKYSKCRFFEVEAKGDIVARYDKLACSDIKLVREITKEEFDKYFLENVERLSKDKDWRVRCRVAENPNTPINILIKMSEDKKSNVRCEVARNPNTPIEILKQLSEDVRGNVRTLATEKLEKMKGDK